jgi:DNA-binding response OmpR family regulator
MDPHEIAEILVVEDDSTIALGIVKVLEMERFRVRSVPTGEEAIEEVARQLPDLVVLDWMLPGRDGLSVLAEIKDEHPEVPVILLTARTSEVDRVLGLEMGADDYVPKPFSLRELVARIRARLRTQSNRPRTIEVLRIGNAEVDLRRRVVRRNGRETRLTTHEAGVLGYLVARPGSDVPREELLERVWGYLPTTNTRTVDNQILQLRKKIEDNPADPRHILTVFGTGYRFEP